MNTCGLVAHRGIEPSLSRMKILSPQTDRRMRHLIHYSETYLALPEQHLVAVMFHCCSCGGGTRTTRPPGYGPGELPLLYPAIYIKTENVFDYLIP